MAMQNVNEYDVFISYRHETGFYMAQILYSDLIAKGYTVFMDKNMDSGKYEDKIHTAIMNSRNFISVLFPDDVSELNKANSWLNIEANWALENPTITIIPVMCDGFSWSKVDSSLTETMRCVKKNNGLTIHKDYSLDKDLDSLCDVFLKNVNPSKPKITAVEFFKYNLEEKHDYDICGVDVAFHAGSPWLMPGEKNDLLVNSLKRGIRWRVLINTVQASESIGQHMRDKTALYIPFEQVHAQWKKMAELFPEVLEVRECAIPLIHIHHSVRFTHQQTGNPYSELHIKYYAYNNTRLDNAFEHRLNSLSKYYSVYSDEFEFLWQGSKNL